MKNTMASKTTLTIALSLLSIVANAQQSNVEQQNHSANNTQGSEIHRPSVGYQDYLQPHEQVVPIIMVAPDAASHDNETDSIDAQLMGQNIYHSPLHQDIPLAFSVDTPWASQARELARSAPLEIQTRIQTISDDLHRRIVTAREEGKPFLIWVNVPSYTLRVYNTQNGQLELTSRVIVGSAHTRTPIFETNIVNLKFNPDWSPPPSLLRQGRVYTPPGPNNPLGQVRFSADNNQNIYLHDTNNHTLYEREMRALSAGCVRVEQWSELARILSFATSEDIERHTEGNRTHFVNVQPSQVWISYERLDLNEYNALEIFPDVYRRQPFSAALVEEFSEYQRIVASLNEAPVMIE